MAFLFLPVLLPESGTSCTQSKKGKKRSIWKPSLVESMEYFIDVQKVNMKMFHYVTERIIANLFEASRRIYVKLYFKYNI